MRTNYIVTSADEEENQTFVDSIYAESKTEAAEIATRCRPYATICETEEAVAFVRMAAAVAATTVDESDKWVAEMIAAEDSDEDDDDEDE